MNDDDIKISVFRDPMKPQSSYCVSITDRLLGGDEFAEFVMRTIAEKVAEKYVQEHYGELSAKLDQQAISNLAIADSGKKIAEEIRSRPTVLHDKETKREVYKVGMFGGLHRVL